MNPKMFKPLRFDCSVFFFVCFFFFFFFFVVFFLFFFFFFSVLKRTVLQNCGLPWVSTLII